MACRLILNADDFGLTRGVNRAIAELHQSGAITSTTLMATGPAFEDAVTLTASLPRLGVGCHVVLVDGVPASPPAEIPSLLGSNRKTFRPTLGGFVRDLLLGCIREAEIAHEAEAQIRKLQTFGIRVTHVDTHKHTHMFPRVARAVLFAAQRCGVPAIRNPFEPRSSIALSRDHASRIRLWQLSALGRMEPSFLRLLPQHKPVRTTNGTLGIAVTGSLDAAAIHKMLEAATMRDEEEAVYEFVCHPGYNDSDLARTGTRLREQREIERCALLEVAAAWHGLRLIHYGDLSK